jgi:threonine/homoserine/homoserine lactone efflux protein
MSALVASAAAFAFLATVSPGGATTLATASGTRFGFRRSVPLLVGIAAGLATLAAAAGLGLATVMSAVPGLELATRIAGTAYLLWLAWGIARSGAPKGADLARPRTLLNGVLLLWLNPKAWAMTLSAAAAFAGSGTHITELAAVLGACFGLGAAASLVLWCAAGTLFARLFRTERQWRVLNAVLAALLVASIIPMWIE